MPSRTPAIPGWFRALAALAVLFGLTTLAAGGRVLFGGAEARQAAGAVVPFVLWFNFAAGFAYVAAGVGLWLRRRRAAWLALGIAGATALVFAAFAVYVAGGGDYEPRTVLALTFRTGVWGFIGWVGLRRLPAEGGRRAV